MDCYRAASQELKRRIEETNITAEQKRKEVRDRFPVSYTHLKTCYNK